jgi:hypothetical protein
MPDLGGPAENEEAPRERGFLYSGGGIRTRDLRVMRSGDRVVASDAGA